MLRSTENEVKFFKKCFYFENNMYFKLAYISNAEDHKTLLQEQNLLSTKLSSYLASQFIEHI